MNTPPCPDFVSAPRVRPRLRVRGGSLASDSWIADGGQLPPRFPVADLPVVDISGWRIEEGFEQIGHDIAARRGRAVLRAPGEPGPVMVVTDITDS